MFQATLDNLLASPKLAARRGTVYQDLIEKVLDELLLQRSRGEESVQISA